MLSPLLFAGMLAASPAEAYDIIAQDADLQRQVLDELNFSAPGRRITSKDLLPIDR